LDQEQEPERTGSEAGIRDRLGSVSIVLRRLSEWARRWAGRL